MSSSNLRLVVLNSDFSLEIVEPTTSYIKNIGSNVKKWRYLPEPAVIGYTTDLNTSFDNSDEITMEEVIIYDNESDNDSGKKISVQKGQTFSNVKISSISPSGNIIIYVKEKEYNIYVKNLWGKYINYYRINKNILNAAIIIDGEH